ncbi:hypothetical protein Bca52824_020831 [Brassica carinata]|uniref:Uncharacterized protein n=1 Tax=Brassica carinata TaxID=52824 RepID=A0A8X8AYV5_BRACI|nr:hypothetical protein Bca52824_020831 [Brassica carinata]
MWSLIVVVTGHPYHGRVVALAAAARTMTSFSTMLRHVQVLVKLGQTGITEMVQCREFMSVKERCNLVGS